MNMEESFILLKPGNYISRIWFFHKNNAEFDVMMALTRKLPNDDWILKYRFRYYRDNKAFDSDDKKSFWSATFPQKMTEAEAVRKVGPVVQKLKAMTRLDFDIIIAESDNPEIVIALMQKSPFFFMQYEEKKS